MSLISFYSEAFGGVEEIITVPEIRPLSGRSWCGWMTLLAVLAPRLAAAKGLNGGQQQSLGR